MKKLTMALSLLIVIVGFQNCGKQLNDLQMNAINNQNASSSGNSNLSGAVDSSQDSIKLKQMTAIEIPLASNIYSLDAAQKTDSASKLLLSIESGYISVLDSAGQVASYACLKPEEVTELRSIIAMSRVCQVQQVDPNRMCTMIVKMPYASLYNEVEKLPLGQALDGCGTGAKVLCGDQDQMLRAFLESVKVNYPNRKCKPI